MGSVRAPNRRYLVDRISHLSLAISAVTIIVVQVISLFIVTAFMIMDLKKSAAATADEISFVLIEPLYNVDDAQTRRIVETLLSTGRIQGFYLESSISGVLVDTRPSTRSGWIDPQIRTIRYRNIELGRMELYYGDSILVGIIEGILTIMVVVIGAVIGANSVVNRLLIRNQSRQVFDTVKSGLNRIANGHYDEIIAECGFEDMDSIIRVINAMARSIMLKSKELLFANATLEERVAERTKELESTLAEQRRLQDRLVESGKLTALGQLSAGIAHELNTPLAATQSSIESIAAFFDTSFMRLVLYPRSLDEAEMRLFGKVIEIGLKDNRSIGGQIPDRKTVQRLAAKLVGIEDGGKIAQVLAEANLADSAGEIIPLLSTRRNAEIVKAAAEVALARNSTEVIHESTQKSATVVSALKDYLSPQPVDENAVTDVPADITRVLTLMHNLLKHGITVSLSLEPAKVRGSSDKLTQVWMNIIRNAAQAMEGRGSLEIATEVDGDWIRVRFADSGPGIPADIQDRIFEPFFTTKTQGDGMGLGLDICRKIVESYKGTIRFDTRPGRTEFIVSLPRPSAQVEE